MESDITDYLGSGEKLLSRWTGSLIPHNGDLDSQDNVRSMSSQRDVEFGATDKRIVYLNRDGGFKDIGFNHIISVEVNAETKEVLDDYQKMGAAGVFFTAFGAGSLFIEPIAGLILTMVALGLTWYTIREKGGFVETFNYDKKTTGYKIKFITGDGMRPEIVVKTEDNVVADLSRIVRENSE